MPDTQLHCRAQRAQLTRPCRWARCLCLCPGQGCGPRRAVAPAPGAACLCGPRRTSCGRCPCGPSRAAARVRAACCRKNGRGRDQGGSPRRTGIGRCLSGSHGSNGHSRGSCCSERARAICSFLSAGCAAHRIISYHIISYRIASRLGRAHGDASRCAARARAPTRRPTVAQSGDKQRTHPFDAIVTIGTMSRSRRASWAGSVA